MTVGAIDKLNSNGVEGYFRRYSAKGSGSSPGASHRLRIGGKGAGARRRVEGLGRRLEVIYQMRLDSAAGLKTAIAVTATMKRRTIMALSWRIGLT